MLACVGHRGEAFGAGELEGGRVRLRRMLGLGSAQADADHAPVAVFDRVADYLQGFFEAVHARDVGR